MKAQIAAKALERLKTQLATASQLEKLGVNTTDYDTPYICMIEELICGLFAKDDHEFDKILEDVQWWLEESETKIIQKDGPKIDVSDPKEFVKILTTIY